MNPFEIAKKMELDMKNLYLTLLNQTTNEGLKSILKIIIKQEDDHYKIFEKMEKTSPKKIEVENFTKIKSFFQEINSSKIIIPKEQLNAYEIILSFEIKSKKYYTQLAEKQTDSNTKEQLLEIAKEENKHEIIISNIIEYVKKPLVWIENAEFNHLDEY